MPTADAALLPPPLSFSDSDDASRDDEPRSGRSLNAVGVQAVLGAMIEHRRASQPSFASVVVPTQGGVLELSDEDHPDERAPDRQPLPARARTSEVFLKVR